jgi:thioredoxin reductase
MRGRLIERAISIMETPIAALEGEGSVLRIVCLGMARTSTGTRFSFPQSAKIRSVRALGCLHDEKGGIVTDALTEVTSTPGVYVAGDVSRTCC